MKAARFPTLSRILAFSLLLAILGRLCCRKRTWKQAESGQGKPVLICILARSLGFHAIALEHSPFMKITSFKNQACVCLNRVFLLLFYMLLKKRREQTHRDTP